jgi:hypothetical protein
VGYEIGVSYSGLEAIANALDSVASDFSAAAGQVGREEPQGAEASASAHAHELSRAASMALGRAARSASSLAEQVSRSSRSYATNERGITASELTHLKDRPG